MASGANPGNGKNLCLSCYFVHILFTEKTTLFHSVYMKLPPKMLIVTASSTHQFYKIKYGGSNSSNIQRLTPRLNFSISQGVS